MAGIITGIAATLSMAASNYLAERADGNPNALKASVYTGFTYLFTVVFLVLPYLLFPRTDVCSGIDLHDRGRDCFDRCFQFLYRGGQIGTFFAEIFRNVGHQPWLP